MMANCIFQRNGGDEQVRERQNDNHTCADAEPKPEMVHKPSNGYPSYTTAGVRG